MIDLLTAFAFVIGSMLLLAFLQKLSTKADKGLSLTPLFRVIDDVNRKYGRNALVIVAVLFFIFILYIGFQGHSITQQFKILSIIGIILGVIFLIQRFRSLNVVILAILWINYFYFELLRTPVFDIRAGDEAILGQVFLDGILLLVLTYVEFRLKKQQRQVARRILSILLIVLLYKALLWAFIVSGEYANFMQTAENGIRIQ